MPSSSDTPVSTRRELMALMGASGVAGMAGCLGDDEPGDTEPTPTPTDTPTPTPPDTGGFQTGGTLRVAMAENIASFDPPYSNDTTSAMAQSFLFENLYTTDAQGNVFNWVASSSELVEINDVSETDYEPYMKSVPFTEDGALDTDDQIIIEHPDNDPETQDEGMVLTVEEAPDAVADGTFGMQFTYEMHEGIEFHDGEELTAENVLLTFERIQHSFVDAQTWDQLLMAEADGDYTVHLYSKFPDAEAYRDLGPYGGIIPTALAEQEDGQADPREGFTPIGSGPYEFSDFEDAQYYIVEKNDNYWLDDQGLDVHEWWDGPPSWWEADEDFPTSPAIETLDMDLIPSNPVRSAALQNGEVDLTYGISGDTLTDFEASDDFEVVVTQSGGYTYLQYPMQVEPWDNENLRRGANHLIPREAIANDIYAGWVAPAWTPLASLARGAGTADYDALESELRPLNEYDPDAAADFIEQAIEEDDIDTPIEIQLETNADNDERVRMVELIAESMNASGYFDATVETFEWLTYLGRILSTEYQFRGHIYCVGLSATFNPDSFCGATNHTRNIGQCCNANGVGWDDLDDLIDEALFGLDVVEDPDLRAEKYDEIWKIIVERSGSVYAHFPTNEAVMASKVKGFAAYPFNEGLLSYGLWSPQAGVVSWIEDE